MDSDRHIASLVGQKIQGPEQFSTDDDRYAAVARRDTSADGHFFYSVRSTGVYCRPSCAARLAKRVNVAFHATCAAAEHAGFRPCKRCRPNEATLAERQAHAVTEACRRIEDAETEPSLTEIAAAVGFSPHHFHRMFKAITGITPKAYARAHRSERARGRLAQAPTVTEAIYDAGFGASSRFYADANQRLGMTPTAYRDGGAGAAIKFAVGECSLGSVLVATTAKGVCAILLGDDPDSLVRDLQDRFPKAALEGGNPHFEQIVAQVIGLIEFPEAAVTLPLDIGGTAFQQRVWEALCAIPIGETASYADIAKRINSPRAVRAVAQACSANALAIAIPCHRVVRSDGALSGYRWGVERKRILLDRESEAHRLRIDHPSEHQLEQA